MVTARAKDLSLTINDAINITVAIICAVGVYGWLVKLRRWPLRVLAVLALASNVAFIFVKVCGYSSPDDLNLLSLTRILLMALIIAAVPWSVPKITP
jgi:hypothetical protein